MTKMVHVQAAAKSWVVVHHNAVPGPLPPRSGGAPALAGSVCCVALRLKRPRSCDESHCCYLNTGLPASALGQASHAPSWTGGRALG